MGLEKSSMNYRSMYLTMEENKERKGNGAPDIQCPICTESWKTDSEESQVRHHTHSLQQTNPAGNILPTPASGGVHASLPSGAG